MNGSTLTQDLLMLPPRQAKILAFVEEYYRLTREACPAHLVARRFERSTPTIREHFGALYRKGWLRSESSPAIPKRRDNS